MEVPQLPCLVDVCSQFIDGCERLCAHSETLFVVQFLDKVVDMLVVSNYRCAAGAVPVVVDVPVIKQRQLGSRHDASIWRFWRR